MKEKIKELTKDTVIYGISTIVGRFLGFILTPFYTNVLNPDDYGIFSNIYAYIAFFNILFIYGMDAAFMKYSSVSSDENKRKIFSTAYIFVFATTVILSFLLLLFRNSFAGLMEVPTAYSELVYYVVLILAFDTLALIPFSNLRLERKAIKFTAIKLSSIIINVALNFILVLVFGLGLKAIFIANLVSSVFAFAILTPDIFKNLKLSLESGTLKRLLKFGLFYLPAGLAAMIVQVIDRPVVLALTDAATLGVYQANYKLGIFMMLFVSMFQYAWQPFFLNNAREANAKELFSKVLTLFLITAGFLWILVSLFVEDFARFELLPGVSIIGQKFLGGISIVPIILLGYLFNGLYYNFQAGIYIEEKTKYFPVVTGAGAAVNVLVNFLLIPVLGLIGAALATLASYVVMAGGLFYFSQKYYPIKYEYAKVFKILSLIVFCCCVYYYVLFNFGMTFPFKLVLLLFFALMLVLLRVLDKNEIVRIGKLLFRMK